LSTISEKFNKGTTIALSEKGRDHDS